MLAGRKRLYFLFLLNYLLLSSLSHPDNKTQPQEMGSFHIVVFKFHLGKKSHTEKDLKEDLYLLLR